MIAPLLDSLEVNLGHALRLDARRLRQTEASARVLLAFEPGEALPMTRVAERLARDPSTATRFVDRAEADGLVVRVAAEADRRSRLARLTPQGEDLRRALVDLRTARGRTLVAAVDSKTGLGADQVQWFLQALAEAASRRFNEVMKEEQVAQAQSKQPAAPSPGPAAGGDPWTATMRWLEYSDREYRSIMRKLALGDSAAPAPPAPAPATKPTTTPAEVAGKPAPSEQSEDWLTRSSQRFQSRFPSLASGSMGNVHSLLLRLLRQ